MTGTWTYWIKLTALSVQDKQEVLQNDHHTQEPPFGNQNAEKTHTAGTKVPQNT